MNLSKPAPDASEAEITGFRARLQMQIGRRRGRRFSPDFSGPKDLKELAERAVRLYPGDWTRTAQARAPYKLRAQPARRGFYEAQHDLKAAILHLSPGSLESAVHEFAHHLQEIFPGLQNFFSDFHARRTVGEVARPLSELTRRAFGVDEVAKPDKYATPYYGRVYGSEDLMKSLWKSWR